MSMGHAPFTSFARGGARPAFTIVEAVMSMLIVCVMLTAALRVAAYTVTSQARAADRQTGRLLAQALIDEITTKPYEDPDGTSVLGIEPGEAKASRSDFDDVDDYDGLAENPPKEYDGRAIPGLTGWKRTVSVQLVDPADLTKGSAIDKGVKLITVTVSHNAAKAAQRVAVRARVP